MFFKKLLLFKSTRNARKDAAFTNGIFAIAFFFITLFSFPNMVFGQNASYLTSSSLNTYTLLQGATTSAGVYRPDSTLVRTLWSAVYRNAGTYQVQWDGKDDVGNQMPAGNYIVKVLANNVVYTWMGIVGNTSDNETGSTVHRGYYYCMAGMAVVNGTAYYCKGYSEGSPSIDKFVTSKPQQKINILPFNATTANTDIVASDGVTVFWAAYDPYATQNSFVYGTKVSDDSNMAFAAGINYKLQRGISYNSIINYINKGNSLITGLAVQKAGNYLFVARAGLNQLSVLNKKTGKLLQTIPVTNPKALGVDMKDNLWMISDNKGITQVSKYNVNANGLLSPPILTISSVLTPVALGVSPDNSTIAIADGNIASQQIKAFDNSTGKPVWTLGTPGGYMQDATVTNNKFYFNDITGKMYYNSFTPGFCMFIAFQPDGSFWVNDPGNYRVQHYSPNRQFIETIMSMGATYSTWADKNDNTRVGAEYLEFKIDNTQPISGTTGWQLVKNWGATIPVIYDHGLKFTNVITLTSAGVSHNYGILRNYNNTYEVVEFQKNNTLRFTGIIKPHCNIEIDGSLITDNLVRYAFQGFDNLNNPVWSRTPQILANIALIPDRGPLPKGGFKNTFVTSTGKVIFYDYGINLTFNPVTNNTGYHLGAIQSGGNSYLWETAMATHLSYKGFFPDPGHFDIGNNVNNYAGSSAMVSGRNIITGYHGEFWKNSQTNMYNHYLDNGLAIGQFGTVGPYYIEAPAMMAGNELSPQLVNGANADELYLWHGDESFHAGMHKWKISGLSTIVQQDIPMIYPTLTLAPPVIPGNNLMVNLPYDSNLLNNTAGWTLNPATTTIGWSVKTNVFVSGVQNNPDIFLTCSSATGAFSLNRDLGNNTGLLSWSVDGQINYFNSNQGGQMQEYFDVLDNNGKIIARLTNLFVFVDGKGHDINTIYGNGKVLVTGLNPIISSLKNSFQNVSLSVNNKLVTISYAGYSVTTTAFDPTASIGSPTTMRCYITGGYNPTGRNFDFKDMRFTSAKTNQTINFIPSIVTINGNPNNSLIAMSSSGLPVTFTVVSGPATVTGNIITLLSNTGTVVIQASQAGDSVYNAAVPVTQSFALNNLQIIRIDL